MGAVGQSIPAIRFGDFEVDVASHELRKNGNRIKLQEQPFQILLLLLERPGKVVTREQLQQKLWPADTFVDFDHSLNTAVKKLRQALGDSPEAPRFIETLPRIGYRLLAPVKAAAPAGGAGWSGPRPHRQTLLGSRSFVWAGLGAALLLAGLLIYLSIQRAHTRASANGQKVKIAVLPFQNLSGDPNQEFFSDGMTEETIAQLSALDPKRLGVIARTSALKYKGSTKGVDQIGRELNVEYVLEGSIREADGRVRITAQLIQVKDQMHVWSESFERDLRGLLALQRDVADAIARKINVNLPSQSARPIGSDINWEAYSAYLKGRHMLLDTKTDDSVRLAVSYFKQAIKADPDFALAYAGLADAYSEQADRDLPPEQAFGLSKETASKALEIDPNLAEAYVSLANLQAFHDWNWAEAEKSYKRALDLKPTYEEAHHSYSHYLTVVGRHQEAIAASKRLLELDPLSPHMNGHLGLAYLRAGRLDDAIAQLRRAIQIDPTYLRPYHFLGVAYEQKGMYPESIQTLQKTVSLRGNSLEGLSSLAHVYITSGKRVEGVRILHDLEQRSRKQYISSVDLAALYVALGEQSKALDLLERAYRERNYSLPYVGVDIGFRALDKQPRFQQLLEALALPNRN